MRIKVSWNETQQESKYQLEVQKLRAHIFENPLFNGSSMGTIQRVLEQGIGIHEVFGRVEHRLRGDELQERSNKLCKNWLKGSC